MLPKNGYIPDSCPLSLTTMARKGKLSKIFAHSDRYLVWNIQRGICLQTVNCGIGADTPTGSDFTTRTHESLESGNSGTLYIHTFHETKQMYGLRISAGLLFCTLLIKRKFRCPSQVATFMPWGHLLWNFSIESLDLETPFWVFI